MTKKATLQIPRISSRLSARPAPEGTVFTQYLGKLELKPRQQTRMSLGLFDKKTSPKGFCINLKQDPETPDTIVSHVNSPLGRMDMYELTLQITNYGSQKIDAEIWQM